jgi:Co/Zn/Cd efflux system component
MACCDDACAVTRAHIRVLQWVFAFNAAMFFIEGFAGWIAGSSALMADSLDMLANLAVLLAAGGVVLTGQAWPDAMVGLAIVLLFSHTAIHVTRAAMKTLAQ